MFMVHGFEYIARLFDMPSNTVWPKEQKRHTHTDTFCSHQHYACRTFTNHRCTKPLDPCNVIQEMLTQPTWILHISHPLTTCQHIPSYAIIYKLCQPHCITCNRQDSTVSSRGCGSAGIWSCISTAASSTA